MKDEEIISKLEQLLAESHEMLMTSQDLLNKSEARIDDTNKMIQRLIDVVNESHAEKEAQFTAMTKRINETRKDKKACIARYEEKLDRITALCEEVQKQNDDFIETTAAKDRQIAKLESILMSQLSHANVTVGDFKIKKED